MFLKFPDNFLWGTATSSHQVEGGNFNDWSEWERETAKFKIQNAKLGNWPEYILKKYPNPLREENYISGRACDHYNRYEEDFDIVKKLNNNAHRFSVEWSRIEPREGEWNQKEIEHYRKVLMALHERHIEPFVTLWHFTNPVWFSQKGGWENKKAPFYFERYAEKVINGLGDLAHFWITFNEPLVFVGQGYLAGIWPPQKRNLLKAGLVIRHLIKAHNITYVKIKAINQNFQIGLAHNLKYNESYKNKIINKLLKYFLDYFGNDYFFRRLSETQDFLGCNYYQHNRVKFSPLHPLRSFKDNENKVVSDMNWEVYSEGIYHVLKDLEKYKKPIYITENGLADSGDKYRADFIKNHLRWIHRAIQEGVDVRGYFHWSLLDNFEWDKGFWPRFGLVEVDYRTMERRVRDSAREYAEICNNNGILS